MVADTQAIPRRNLGYLLGLGGVLLAALCGSSAGILLRHIEAADGWQVLFYRSLSFSLLLFLVVVLRRRGDSFRAFCAIGWWGLAVALFLGGAFIAFVFAMLLTTVAEAVLILSAAPFVAAILGRVILGEAVAPATWLAMAGAACGIAIMMAGGLAGGGLSGGLVALMACCGYAFCIVALRAGRAQDMMPATCLAGVVALAVSAVFATPTAPISGHDLVLALLLGSGQIGLQYLLITLSARWVPAAEIALLMLLEVVLAPVWVWIGIGEVPATRTLIGGAVVLAALLGQGLFLLFARRKAL